MTETARRYTGKSVPRKEDPALLTGRATFTDDIRLLDHWPLARGEVAQALQQARNQA